MLSAVKWMNLLATRFCGIIAPVAWSIDFRVLQTEDETNYMSVTYGHVISFVFCLQHSEIYGPSNGSYYSAEPCGQ